MDLRLSPAEKALFAEAANATERTITDFVVQAASLAARDVLADRTKFVLASEQWAAFEQAIDRPPRKDPRLAVFLAEPSVLDR